MIPEETTERLLLRWRSGNNDAGNELLHRYIPELTGFFDRRASGNADELVQRTLVACVRNVGRFEGRSTFRTYLFGIARNQYLMYRRAEAFSARAPAPLATRPEDSPSQLAAVKQEHVILVLALGRVEPDYSLVLRKFYWEERSIDEIARELGIPPGTVKSRLARGRESLRANLARVKLRDHVRADAERELARWLDAREE